jgi:hypothetical protein
MRHRKTVIIPRLSKDSVNRRIAVETAIANAKSSRSWVEVSNESRREKAFAKEENCE